MEASAPNHLIACPRTVWLLLFPLATAFLPAKRLAFLWEQRNLRPTT
jgi:hypothetical protein